MIVTKLHFPINLFSNFNLWHYPATYTPLIFISYDKKYINCDGDQRPTDLFGFKPFIRWLITVQDISRFKRIDLFSMTP